MVKFLSVRQELVLVTAETLPEGSWCQLNSSSELNCSQITGYYCTRVWKPLISSPWKEHQRILQSPSGEFGKWSGTDSMVLGQGPTSSFGSTGRGGWDVRGIRMGFSLCCSETPKKGVGLIPALAGCCCRLRHRGGCTDPLGSSTWSQCWTFLVHPAAQPWPSPAL